MFITFVCFHCVLFGLDVLAGKKSVCFCIEMQFFFLFLFLNCYRELTPENKGFKKIRTETNTRHGKYFRAKKKIDACINAAQVYTLVNCKRERKARNC